jgi:hypothetical protein
MNTEISKHFSAQLQDWIDAIYFDLGLSSRLSDRLEEVIRRNTIVGIADKVEVYQNQLHEVERKLYIIEEKINQQKSLISKNGIEFDNAEIDQAIEEYKVFYKEKLEESNLGTVTENGDTERWVGSVNKERADDSLNEVIQYLENLKKS